MNLLRSIQSTAKLFRAACQAHAGSSLINYMLRGIEPIPYFYYVDYSGMPKD